MKRAIVARSDEPGERVFGDVHLRGSSEPGRERRTGDDTNAVVREDTPGVTTIAPVARPLTGEAR